MKNTFPNNWKFTKIGENSYEVFDGTGAKWATVYENKIVALQELFLVLVVTLY